VLAAVGKRFCVAVADGSEVAVQVAGRVGATRVGGIGVVEAVGRLAGKVAVGATAA